MPTRSGDGQSSLGQTVSAHVGEIHFMRPRPFPWHWGQPGKRLDALQVLDDLQEVLGCINSGVLDQRCLGGIRRR